MIIAVIIANAIMGGLYLFLRSELPPQIPLYYSRPWGEEQLVDLWLIAIIPLMMHMFIVGNTLLKRFFYKKSDLLVNTFTVANWFYLIVFTVIYVRILFLVS